MRVGDVGEDTGARKKGGERVGFCAETAQSGFADARRARSSLQTSGETVGGATRGGGAVTDPGLPGDSKRPEGPITSGSLTWGLSVSRASPSLVLLACVYAQRLCLGPSVLQKRRGE